jgi:hypothetical protein
MRKEHTKMDPKMQEDFEKSLTKLGAPTEEDKGEVTEKGRKWNVLKPKYFIEMQKILHQYHSAFL